MKRPDTAPLDKKSALAKAEHYCAYQERSQQELRDKLYEYGLLSSEVEEVIAELIENNFLNEERFALAYTLGKFRIKGWGKLKIKMALKQKRVPPKMIEKSLKQIDGEEYARKLKEILDKKDAQLKENDDWKRKQKLISYALTKGYERDLILDALTIS
ncbi:regulatory protein RecX [Desertivirga xinjiangensis]|uniref:regulatory protein RecX n=1 Tax=Desertivirga xinjiangensis TaxID=539206 RepID=UPI00210BB6AD|nr:regulatory protein RecX [Pedobacter xinjiangensis]